ncbi:hypothetical protein SLG_03710 [Sphingobium sp. SYK-6]|nr:hypothetical protein SLG_03710 [Sphingobium sp. SYK-6]
MACHGRLLRLDPRKRSRLLSREGRGGNGAVPAEGPCGHSVGHEGPAWQSRRMA